MDTRTTYEILSLLAVAAWFFCYGRQTGVRRGSHCLMIGLMDVAKRADLEPELDKLLCATVALNQRG